MIGARFSRGTIRPYWLRGISRCQSKNLPKRTRVNTRKMYLLYHIFKKRKKDRNRAKATDSKTHGIHHQTKTTTKNSPSNDNQSNQIYQTRNSKTSNLNTANNQTFTGQVAAAHPKCMSIVAIPTHNCNKNRSKKICTFSNMNSNKNHTNDTTLIKTSNLTKINRLSTKKNSIIRKVVNATTVSWTWKVWIKESIC